MTIWFKAKHPKEHKAVSFNVVGPDIDWIMNYVRSRYEGYDIEEATIV